LRKLILSEYRATAEPSFLKKESKKTDLYKQTFLFKAERTGNKWKS